MTMQSRWWEQYYVRYFVGTVYGVLLVSALLLDSPRASLPVAEITNSTHWLSAGVVLAAGLAFCYLASAPVLLLHSLRERFSARGQAFRRIGIGIAVVSLAALACVAWIYIWRPSLILDARLAIAPFLIVVSLQILGLLSFRPDSLRAFYKKLTNRRAAEDASRNEYVESYRHLREHGNALLILLSENVLALALWGAGGPKMMLALIVVWIAPATFVWFMATWLERTMAEEPTH